MSNNNLIRKFGRSFVTENIKLKYHSSITNLEAQKLIGKTIAAIEGDAYNVIFTFTDGSKFGISGFTVSDDGSKDSLDTLYQDRKIEI